MKTKIEIFVSLILVFVLVFSCVNPKLSDEKNYVFADKSEWTANEIESCENAIAKLDADSAKIIFRKANIPGQGQAQPLMRTILRKPHKRTYIIKVQDCNNRNPLCYSVLPDSAKTGLIGHEIIHVMDYQTKGFFGMIKMGIKYSFCRKYHQRVEYVTDSLTIANDMGQEVLIMMSFIHNSGLASESYLKRKEKYYMDSVEVQRIIDSYK